MTAPEKFRRRDFIRQGLGGAAALSVSGLGGLLPSSEARAQASGSFKALVFLLKANFTPCQEKNLIPVHESSERPSECSRSMVDAASAWATSPRSLESHAKPSTCTSRRVRSY